MSIPTPSPRWYVCEEADCQWQGRPRPVLPTFLASGFVEWPVALRCPCNPEGLDCRQVPASARVDLAQPRPAPPHRPAPLPDPTIGGAS